MSKYRLVADIGGTNTRVAIAANGTFDPAKVHDHKADTIQEIQQIFRNCLTGLGVSDPIEAAIAVAAPVTGDIVTLTNRGLSFSVAEVERNLGLGALTVVNDFVGVAIAVPYLQSNERCKIGGGTVDKEGPIAIIGPGTGLGVASLVPTANGSVVVPGEGGHATMSPADAIEGEVLDFLRQDKCRADGEAWRSHVSAERVLSGPGLVSLYNAIHFLANRRPAPDRTPEQITNLALNGHDAISRKAVDMFCSMLGTVAGNLALILGATGGVYIAGGIVPIIESHFVKSNFRKRFEQKGRFDNFLQQIPTFLIRSKHPVLLGLAMMGDTVRGPLSQKPVLVRHRQLR